MEQFSSSGNDRFQVQGENLQQTVLTQLSQAVTTMQHIDEVFLWLVQAIVIYFGAQVAQIWTIQTTTTGQRFPQLRSMMCQDRSLPQNLIVNKQVAALAGHMLSERRNAQLHPVEASFTQYLALLLKRYGLSYCAGSFVGGDTLLPPPRVSSSEQKIATPLAVVLLLFFQHMPHQNVLPAAEEILAQAFPIASSHGLLLSASAAGAPSYAEPVPRVQPSLPALSELIAHRIEDPMSNPLSAALALPEERTRHVYAAINDRRNLAELSRLTNLDLSDVFQIVQKLAAMHRVQVYEPTGRHVENLGIFE